MVYFTVDLFIDALVLIFHSRNEKTVNLVKKLLEVYEEESKESSYSDNGIFTLCVSLIQEIIVLGNEDNEALRNTLLLKIKSNPVAQQDPETMSSLKQIFINKEPISLGRISYITKKLNNCILWYSNTKFVKKIFGKVASASINTTPTKQEELISEINNLYQEVIQMNHEALETKDELNDSTRANFLDFTDPDNLRHVIKVFKTTTVVNKFKTGLQAFNRALNGGWTLGESIVFNALAGNAKSLMLLKMPRWQVTLNRPSMEFKNPTILFYSLENETPRNAMLFFQDLYVNTFGVNPPSDMSDDDVIGFCVDSFKKYGWKLIVDRRLGKDFGFAELAADVEKYSSVGYNVLMVVVDYMNMMKKCGGDTVGSWTQLKEIYTNTINFLKARNCTLVTAHQLNRKAADIVAMNPIGAVKKFNMSMLADGMDPQREVDVSIFMHKEADASGRVFLTFKLDKHRYDTSTPEEYKYFAYQFKGELGILDDIDTGDQSTTNIYAVPFEDEESSSDDLFK